jgi:ubiquinone/menaquinone biosynthesis C-methylase UbiE
MKTRESGMPEEEYWSSFFQPETILAKLDVHTHTRDVVEFGCGYGTFTIPAANRVKGIVYAFDIEPEMVKATREKAHTLGVKNIQVTQRDIVENGTGLPEDSIDYVMVFNILHAEKPEVLLRESWRIIKPGGKLGIIHWNYDPSTPRGPSMDIRPTPEQCRAWAESVGFQAKTTTPIDLPPYHYGWVMKKGSS